MGVIVKPPIVPEDALRTPDSVTLKGANAGLTLPAQNLISSPMVTAEESPTNPAISVIVFGPIIHPPILPRAASISPLINTLQNSA